MENTLSREDIAETLGLSVATIDRLRKEPGFPNPARLEGSLRWRESAIDAWIDARCTPSLSPTQPAAVVRRRRSATAAELMG